MSSVIVEVVKVDEVKRHPNADRLCLARIKGWQTVIAKRGDGSSQFVRGEKVVYIPPDSVLPRSVADKIGVTSYLAERTDIAGDRVLVVKRVSLRGEPSFGLVVAPDDPGWELGRDVKDHYQIERYLPPARPTEGDAEKAHPLFEMYTEIENLRHFPDLFEDGEEVVVTEKIHGANVEGESARNGLVVLLNNIKCNAWHITALGRVMHERADCNG